MNVLLVEDSADDIELTQEAIEEVSAKSKVVITLHISRNGEEAIDFIEGQSIIPDLILLDLNMPRMGGLEFLSYLKNTNHPQRTIPVVVLTTSMRDEDILLSYQRFCNAYLEKPVSYGGFVCTLDCLSTFWFSIATLPPS